MPSFRALPPSLRGVVRTQPNHHDAKRIHVPVARAVVDCGVYVDGKRLPGKYTHAAALAKVHELEEDGKQGFVWIGLHEPDHHQMQAVADVFGLHELAVEDAVHAHQRPKLERYLGQSAVLAVADRHDEVAADKDHDLAGLHDFSGPGPWMRVRRSSRS
jgi:magnesium transporter